MPLFAVFYGEMFKVSYTARNHRILHMPNEWMNIELRRYSSVVACIHLVLAVKVGMATCCRLEMSRSWILLGVKSSLPTQTGCGSHLASYTVSISSFPGCKVDGARHLPWTSSSAKVRESVLPMWAFMACFRVKFTFTCNAIMQVFPFLNDMVLLSKLVWFECCNC
jgi:hypothetical protein